MHVSAIFLSVLLIYIAAAQQNAGDNRPGIGFNLYRKSDGYARGYEAAPRIFFETITFTVFSTSTSTATCTLSTKDTCAAGRRKRSVLLEQNDEQFLISPSTVQKVEITEAPTAFREAIADNPPLFFGVPRDPYQGFSPYPQPQSAMISPFSYNQHFYPSASVYHPHRFYGVENIPGAASPRLFFNFFYTYSQLVRRRRTTTSVIFTVRTSTSTPACSTTGPFPQCPNL